MDWTSLFGGLFELDGGEHLEEDGDEDGGGDDAATFVGLHGIVVGGRRDLDQVSVASSLWSTKTDKTSVTIRSELKVETDADDHVVGRKPDTIQHNETEAVPEQARVELEDKADDEDNDAEAGEVAADELPPEAKGVSDRDRDDKLKSKP